MSQFNNAWMRFTLKHSSSTENNVPWFALVQKMTSFSPPTVHQSIISALLCSVISVGRECMLRGEGIMKHPGHLNAGRLEDVNGEL